MNVQKSCKEIQRLGRELPDSTKDVNIANRLRIAKIFNVSIHCGVCATGQSLVGENCKTAQDCPWANVATENISPEVLESPVPGGAISKMLES